MNIISFLIGSLAAIFLQTDSNIKNKKIIEESKKRAIKSGCPVYHDSKGECYYIGNDKPCVILRNNNGDEIIVDKYNLSKQFINISAEKRKIKIAKAKNSGKKGVIEKRINCRKVSDWYLNITYIGKEIGSDRLYELKATSYIPYNGERNNCLSGKSKFYYWLGYFDGQLEPIERKQISKEEYLCYGGVKIE